MSTSTSNKVTNIYLWYDQEFQLQAPRGPQTSNCPRHSKLYQYQEFYRCPLRIQLPTHEHKTGKFQKQKKRVEIVTIYIY